MDHDTLVVAAELLALFVLGGFGLWRIYRMQRSNEQQTSAPSFDMRRDGQRLGSQ